MTSIGLVGNRPRLRYRRPIKIAKGLFLEKVGPNLKMPLRSCAARRTEASRDRDFAICTPADSPGPMVNYWMKQQRWPIPHPSGNGHGSRRRANPYFRFQYKGESTRIGEYCPILISPVRSRPEMSSSREVKHASILSPLKQAMPRADSIDSRYSYHFQDNESICLKPNASLVSSL
ncbi:hypothetical protein GOBAR_DD06282 [Gossypium barbadense]|nr:hypothetical protein GOBAR_DD06282 [Gossypium barbadense]